MGGFKGLLLGSVSTQIVNNAQCTVVVVKSADDVHSAATRTVDEAADK
ncbi:MAG: universal stress protein [Antricoccus sp.]